jgi:hypothetical protein
MVSNSGLLRYAPGLSSWAVLPPDEYCQETCLKQYMECLKATGQQPLEFRDMNEAIDWLKRHRPVLKGHPMSTDSSKTSKEFDLEGTLNRLGKLAGEKARTPEDIAAIKSAAEALHFLHLHGKLDDYLDYLQDVESAAKPMRRVEVFGNMSEALKWLCAQPDPRFGARVEVEGKPYVVVRQRKELWFLIPAPPIPSFEELTATSIGDEVEPDEP